MTYKKPQSDYGKWTAVVVGILLGLVAVWSTQAADFNKKFWIGNADTDSAFIVLNNASDSSLIDSMLFVGSFPRSTTYVLSTSTDYSVSRGNNYRGRWYPWDDPPVKFTGAAASVDYGQVYDTTAVLLTDSSHLFGGGSAGGPYARIIKTLNTADSTPVAGIPVGIFDMDGNKVWQPIPTSSVGSGVWSSTADSLEYRTHTLPWVATFDTTVNTGDQTDTVWMTAFDPGAPTDSGFCRCWFYVQSLRSDPTYGTKLGVKGFKVSYEAAALVKNSCNDTYPPNSGPFEGTSDSTGYVYVDLAWSSCLLSGSTEVKYKLTIGSTEVTIITVPDSSSYKVF